VGKLVDETPPMLAGWDNFYVIIGSSAAGLTGLTFVVIALAADARRVSMTALRAFVTPTIVHFGAALTLAAFMSLPGQRALSLSLGLGCGAVAGLIYMAFVAASMRRIGNAYVPVREDWIWNAGVPALTYALLLSLALTLWRWPEPSHYGIAAVSLLLLFIGIRNAWDVAVWNSVQKQALPETTGSEPAATTPASNASR
jgi:hypothetical protein